jgi:8-oxo-dGTP diphosphatase
MPESRRSPALTVDVIIEAANGITLIRRRHDPQGWAIPGGFVDEGETVEEAAIREAKEETSLDVELVEQFGVYSDPRRDPRRHTISVVFIARAEGTPVAGDDATDAVVVPALRPPSPLCFDHARILSDYARYQTTGQKPRLIGRTAGRVT